jgi:hypothetical protein
MIQSVEWQSRNIKSVIFKKDANAQMSHQREGSGI